MKICSLLKILLSVILFISLIGCYTIIKYNPPKVDDEFEIQRKTRIRNAILSEAGIAIDSSAHILYSIYSYSEWGRSSRAWIIDFDGRRKYYRYRNGKRTLVNDYYLSPKELYKIENLFEKFGFNEFPMTFPRSGHRQTIGGGAIVAFREKVGDDLIISKKDGDTKDEYSLQQIYSFFIQIDKQITGRDYD